MVVSDEDRHYATFLDANSSPGRPARKWATNWANFIEAVRSRKHSDSTRPSKKALSRLRSSPWEHLVSPGPYVSISTQIRIPARAIAKPNAMFQADYRKGFVVPDKV